jgi:phosphonate transport system substrate-binding protein
MKKLSNTFKLLIMEKIMNKKVIYCLLLLSILHFLACGKKEEVKNIKLSEPGETAKIEMSKNVVRVGIAAVISPKEGFLYHKELLDYIEKKLCRLISLKQGHYKEINRLLKINEIDLAFVCSGAYIEAHREFEVQLLVVPVVNNKTEYHSYIIVHQESKIKTFSDLKGKAFAFTDPLSNSGYMFPVFLLAQEGKIFQSYFSRTIFTHSHDNSIIAVAEKLVDAAAVDSLIYDWLSETNPQLISRTKIILTSPPFGIPPVVVPKEIDMDLKENLKNIFLELNKEKRGKDILNKLRINKFVRANERMYDSIRKMKSKIEEMEE